MPLFNYKAVSAAGEIFEGTLDAGSETELVKKIQSMGRILINADPIQGTLSSPLKRSRRKKNTGIGRKSINQGVILSFTESLATLLNAGLTLDKAFHVITQVEDNEQVKEIVQKIQKDVREGKSLSSALSDSNQKFNTFYVKMVQAAEASGKLAAGLYQVFEYMKRSQALKDKIISALIYPAILLFVCLISLSVIMAYVVPQFEPLFQDMGDALPSSTQIILSISDFVKSYWQHILISIALLALVIKAQLATSSGKPVWDRIALNMPLVGSLVQRIETARFCRSLGTLLQSGVPLLTSITYAKETVGNTVMEKDLENAQEMLKKGDRISDALIASGHYPSMALQMIKVGEESGELPEMLMKVADKYDQEVAIQTQRMMTLLEPMMIITLGVAIAAIIISILVGIVSVNDLPM